MKIFYAFAPIAQHEDGETENSEEGKTRDVYLLKIFQVEDDVPMMNFKNHEARELERF